MSMAEDRKVVDYFVVAGLQPDSPLPLEEYSNESIIKPTHKQDPITDITVINRTLNEKVPKGFICLEKTTTTFPADLNHGSIRCAEMYLCYRRGRDKPPLMDIGILYEGKERLMNGCAVVHTTPFGHPANVNNSNSSRTYLTYRRANEAAASDTLAVVDICIILSNKGESPPHAYCQIAKNLNKGMVGSDVYVCYKKAMIKADVLAYKPVLLDRYPLDDFEYFPLPESVPLFCLPMGATIECWSAKAQHPLPVFSTFVLTGVGAEKLYGAAVTFYEEFPEDKLTDLQMRHLGLKDKRIRQQYGVAKMAHSNKCICVLSHWPFFDAFKKFLSYLYKISITGPHAVPLERHISHFMFEVPYPSPQRPRILVQLNHEALSLCMPEDSPLPHSGASFITLLKNLGPDNCMNMLLYVLTEQKILIHSLRPAVLTGVAEAVSSMIFPFHWQCPYIPLCPLGLSTVLSAPIPFIVGIDSRYFDLYDPPTDVICIDLDTNTIWLPEDRRNVSLKQLPKKPARVLQDSLLKLYDKFTERSSNTYHTHDEVTLEMPAFDQDFKRKRAESLMDLQIQEVLLRFMACLMKGYKNYLKPITKAPTLSTTNPTSLFDMTGFLKSRDKAYTKFFTQMMRTQTFIRFIEERSFVSDKDASLAFFDDCTEKVEDTRDEPRLIELDDSFKSERTVLIMPPEPVGLPEGVKYSYNGFPELNPELFPVTQQSQKSLSVKQTTCPNSPMARRTKHEIRLAQKTAHQNVVTPILWAKCLLGHCYSLWFIHLPSYVQASQSKVRALRVAYEVLKKMQQAQLQPPDEICYRVLLQLCGHYQVPVLAVKVLFDMKSIGVQPNAITYGYYNKAVLESKWPAPDSRALLLWTKLRIVVLGVARFKRFSRRRSLSLCSNSGSDCDRLSHVSIDSCLEDQADKADGQKSTIIHTTAAEHQEPDSVHEKVTEDGGYGSLSQEAAKQLSVILPSRETAQSDKQIPRLRSNKQQPHTNRYNSLHLNLQRHRTRRQKSADVTFDDSVCPSEGALVSRSRVASIVRGSLASHHDSTASHDILKGDIVGYMAGLLMVSQSSLDYKLFTQDERCRLLSFEAESIRRRHTSTGSAANLKRRANSMFTHRPMPPDVAPFDENKEQTVEGIHKRLFSAHTTDGGPAEDELEQCDTTCRAMSHGISSQTYDTSPDTRLGSVADSATAAMTLPNPPQVTDDVINSTDSFCTNCGTYNNDADSGVSLTEVGHAYSDSMRNSDDAKILDSLAQVTDNNTVLTNVYKEDSATENEQRQSSSSSSQTGSPYHKLGTPVTENDPLGMLDASRDLAVVSPSMKAGRVEKLVLSSSPRSSRERLAHDDMNSMFKDDTFSSTSLDELDNDVSVPRSQRKEKSATIGSHSAVQSPVSALSASLGRKLIDISRAYSTPEGLSSPEKSQSASWTLPFRQLAQQASLEGMSPQADKVKEFAFRRTQSLRRSKDSFGGFLKSATNVMASKFNELKQSMASPGNEGSSNSLQQTSSEDSESINSMDVDDGLTDVLRGLSGNKRHSMDILHEAAHIKDLETSISTASPQQSTTKTAAQSLFDQPLISIRNWTDGTPSLLDIKQEESDIVMMVEITSCCRCPACNLLLYDEEIMTGWSAEDSNLNTSCIFCSVKFVPHLSVFIKDLRCKSVSSIGLCKSQAKSHSACSQLDSSPADVEIDHDVYHAASSETDSSVITIGTSAVSANNLQSMCDNNPTLHSPVNKCDSLQDMSAKSPCDNSMSLQDMSTKSSCDNSLMDTTDSIPVSSDVEKTRSSQVCVDIPVASTRNSTVASDPEVLRRRCTSECLTSATTSLASRSPSESIDAHYLQPSHSPLELSIDEESTATSQASTPQSIPDIRKEFMLRTEPGFSPVEVPYLSPLVLRKEVENILDNEGDMCLVSASFIDSHPIIFWNLIWYFQRIGIPSHLPGFILTADSVKSNNEQIDSLDAHRHVSVRPMWDNPRIHDEPGLPMYRAWDQDDRSSSTVNALLTESESYPNTMLDEIIGDIKCCDVYKPIQLVMNWRRKSRRRRKRFRSLYRDILFLAIIACGKDKIDLEAYDREFKNGYNRLTPSEIRLLQPNDKPCAEKVICCRSMFKTLEI